MRLLFDQNLSRQLGTLLADLYPQSQQVSAVSLADAPDAAIWDYALGNDFVIVTKDADYRDLSIARGHPPKVIWIRLGNCTTAAVADLLRRRYDVLMVFYRDAATALMELS